MGEETKADLERNCERRYIQGKKWGEKEEEIAGEERGQNVKRLRESET